MLQQTITADWTQSVAVQRILASIAAHPPRTESIPAHERWTREDRRYVGYRVEVLRKVWLDRADAIFAECNAMLDHTEFERFLKQPSVDDAIAGALTLQVAA